MTDATDVTHLHEHEHDELPLAGGCGDGCACGDGEGYETGLDPQLAELLEEAGLDPVEVEDIATLALAEDLAGGEDVTSVATVPADAVATADFTARAAGVVAGLRIAEAVVSLVCEEEFEVERHVQTATGSRPARCCSRSAPAPGTC